MTTATTPRPSQDVRYLETPPRIPEKITPPRSRVLTFAFLSLSLAAGFFATAAESFENALGTMWRDREAQFRWVVVAEGAPIQIDEVGRYLSQMPGVSAVNLISVDHMLGTLRSEPLLSDLRALDPAYFPISWAVQWQAGLFLTKADIDERVSEVARLPAVVDVAYDTREWATISQIKRFWHAMRSFMSLAGLFALFAAALYIGSSFFRPLRWAPVGALIAALGACAAAFGAGVALSIALYGPAGFGLVPSLCGLLIVAAFVHARSPRA